MAKKAEEARGTKEAWTGDLSVMKEEPEILDNYTGTVADLPGAPDIAREREWLAPTGSALEGFELLADEEESRPNPPARGKYPKLLQSLLDRGLAPGKPAMSIWVPVGDEPLLVAEGLKRAGRVVGQRGSFWGEPSRWGQWYIESWVHPTKDRVVQVLAKEGVAPYTRKTKGEVV